MRVRGVSSVGIVQTPQPERVSTLGLHLFLLSVSVLGGSLTLSDDGRIRKLGALLSLSSSALQGLLMASRL